MNNNQLTQNFNNNNKWNKYKSNLKNKIKKMN